MNRWIIITGLGVAILCVATSSILVRFSSAPALAIAFYRLLFTGLLALLLGGLRPISQLSRLVIKDRWLLAGAGIALALHFAAWITSLSYTTVASSVLFANLQVVFVAVIAWMALREKVGLWSLVGILLAFVGSVMVGRGDLAHGRIYGDLLAVLSGLFIAIAFVVARRVRAGIDLWSYTVAVSWVGALVLLIINWKSGIPLTGYIPKEYGLFLLMALLPGIGGHGLFNWALRYVRAPIVSAAVLGETIGASLLAWWLFNEALAEYQIIGGLILLAGLGLAIAGEKNSAANHKVS